VGTPGGPIDVELAFTGSADHDGAVVALRYWDWLGGQLAPAVIGPGRIGSPDTGAPP
jgi:hypothetical protein